jgi:hypothetical protein
MLRIGAGITGIQRAEAWHASTGGGASVGSLWLRKCCCVVHVLLPLISSWPGATGDAHCTIRTMQWITVRCRAWAEACRHHVAPDDGGCTAASVIKVTTRIGRLYVVLWSCCASCGRLSTRLPGHWLAEPAFLLAACQDGHWAPQEEPPHLQFNANRRERTPRWHHSTVVYDSVGIVHDELCELGFVVLQELLKVSTTA